MMNTNGSWNIKLHKSASKLKSTRKCQVNLFEQLDKYTRAHSIRVQKIAQKLGENLRLTRDEINHLGTAALFHDIGKIAVNLDILFKNKKLSAKERQQVHRHPEVGAKLWLQSGGYYRVSEGILSHHENYDGTGYPFGLAGEAIPLWGRIIAIADALDAMLSERPYRQPSSLDFTLKTIQQASGKQFDPYLISEIHKSFKGNGFLSLYGDLWSSPS
ncbi:MAG: HD-GYP domain-containing protein [bacterium]